MVNPSNGAKSRRPQVTSYRPPRATSKLFLLLVVVIVFFEQVNCQLPDDIQRELNQNLAEQARIQAMRARHQQQLQSRNGAHSQQQAQPPYDPNNYSFQQVSPPVQYSYYQPYGDAAVTPTPTGGSQPQARSSTSGGAVPPASLNIDLNNLNFDLPTPQAQVAAANQQQQQPTAAAGGQQHLTPSFTGAGGLPVLQPIAASTAGGGGGADAYAPAGQPPMAPQARVQQGPPLTEADFKDITGGENYGAPGGSDFGLSGMGDGQARSDRQQPQQQLSGADNTDAQLREFGMPDEQQVGPKRRPVNNRRRYSSGGGGGGQSMGNPMQMAGIPDFGSFNSFGDDGGAARGRGRSSPVNDFDFAGQPSSSGSLGSGDQATSAAGGNNDFGATGGSGGAGGGAPGSLESLLGNSFPGLSNGNAGNMGLDSLARGGEAGGQQQGNNDYDGQSNGGGGVSDNPMDIADMGDRSDAFGGNDFGGSGLGGNLGGDDPQQNPNQGGEDGGFGLAAAAASQQPSSVPLPDGAPQPVGTLWALTQPQSLSQTRYNALPDKGTYQDYPAYQSGGNDRDAVARVVDDTPPARRAGPGRYGQPSPGQLAPEFSSAIGGNRQLDYARTPIAADGSELDAEFLGDTDQF